MSEQSGKTMLAQIAEAAKNGRLAEAENSLVSYLLATPNDANAHALNCAIAIQRKDFRLARERAEAALKHLPENARALCNLGIALMHLNDFEEAEAKFNTVIEGAPDYFFAWRNRGILRIALNRLEEGAEDLKAAVNIEPDHADTRVSLADALTQLGQFAEAERQIHEAAKLGTASKIEQTYIWARLKFRMGDYPAARQAFAAALSADPSKMKHYEGLSAASYHCGDAVYASQVTQACIKRFPSIVRSTGDPTLRVLVLEAVGADNFADFGRKMISYAPGNFVAFLPTDRIAYTHVLTDTIDRLSDVIDIEPFDLALNNRTVHERIAKRGQIEKFRRLVSELSVPLINPPDAVARSTREENARKFADAEKFIFPGTIQFSHDLDAAASRDKVLSELSLPVILRPIDTQLGIGARVVKDEQELEQEIRKAPFSDFYAIEYHDCVSDDGLYRRYRCACIGGELIPDNMHAALGWNVHGEDRDTFDWYGRGMDQEELKYLTEPETILGARPDDVFGEIRDKTDLDIFGIDFGRRKDGRIVVFEANASMAISEADLEKFPYRQPLQKEMVSRIEAFLHKSAGK